MNSGEAGTKSKPRLRGHMPTQEIQSRIETGATGWISIHINESKTSHISGLQSPLDYESRYSENVQREVSSRAPATFRLFEYAQQIPATLPERFPRLTFFAIAVALLVSAVAVELDYLHGAGYYWP
jgi:hypothetical protein